MLISIILVPIFITIIAIIVTRTWRRYSKIMVITAWNAGRI
jgi:hypothetical protein